MIFKIIIDKLIDNSIAIYKVVTNIKITNMQYLALFTENKIWEKESYI